MNVAVKIEEGYIKIALVWFSSVSKGLVSEEPVAKNLFNHKLFSDDQS
ncbi:hypothetical protein HYX13_02370 [Candidatus Woesearchaeota archaeon]|nr:hypothetical protein [Candidatus Woesearchaeota archaeon]